MKILIISKYPPIQGGVSVDTYWTAQVMATLGHEVRVVTNANEVENIYRISLTDRDKELLGGFWRPNCVRIDSTYCDPKHLHIPFNNPIVSKLLGTSLTICASWKPDLIWAYYLEPYGVVALLLSKLTGIPYVFKHAGSDLGRLIKTSQLSAIYIEVLKNATAIFTRSIHKDKFTDFGVPLVKLWKGFSVRLPNDVFKPISARPNGKLFQIGVYGKAGRAKGSEALIGAASILKDRGFPFRVRALWGGRDLESLKKQILEKKLEDVFEITSFIGHWDIPKFLSSCDVICCLENGFKIQSHTPFIPFESLSCSRALVTTHEIQNKPSFSDKLIDNKNCYIVSDPVDPANIALRIEQASDSLDKATSFDQEFDTAHFFEEGKRKLAITLDHLSTIRV